MSQQEWEWQVNTGNPQHDQMMLDTYRQQAAAQGMSFDVRPSPTGGYVVKMSQGAPAGFAPPQQQQWGAPAQQQAPQQQWGAPAQQQAQQQQWGAAPQQPAQQQWGAPAQPAGFGQPAMAAVGGSLSSSGLAPEAAGAIGADRIKYLRKVYGLLAISAFIGIAVGYAVLELMPTGTMRTVSGKPVAVPILVKLLLESPVLHAVLFGALFIGTFVASWVSKIKVVNIVALFGVAALMGIDMAPMVFIANYYAGIGATLSTAPVRDAFMMTGGVFAGCTMYVFIAKKDFSYLGSILSMGFWVVLLAGIAGFFLQSEIFSLAIASLGALLSAGFILYQTSYIFKHSAMDDPVDDALVFLVQLRNLFMFLLRIFMSARD
ncbi:MAG: Bax inhibitor-1/YccA family protein [Polyangiaceae bacterium]|nr:Bax inhibitor-1/YccA family protein [Polyangiaceae bacterium]